MKYNAIVISQRAKANLHGNAHVSQQIFCSFRKYTIRSEFCVDLPLMSKMSNMFITSTNKFEVVDVFQENILTGTTAEELDFIMRNNNVRICIDSKDLNKAIKRARHERRR